ncbi:exodeoxyribonuclease VII large subunit [Acetobacteraceae bacterium H6797]|nr:exodeoxyribonuclease VII large subunit [Acetobacteraceae bacterium H6797]
MDENGRPNIPEFTVAELSGAVKRTLEGAFGRVRVRGEVVECKAYGPTRFYFSLKDAESGAKLNSVVWAWSAGRSGVKPENGVEVIATGRLTTYADRSNYQLVVDRLDFAGEGALLARIEMLRRRLEAEGLFDPERKKPIPRLPRVIGVVTSERGAVIQDIRTTLARRFPRHLILWPVAVQGPGSAEQVAEAIRGFDAIRPGGPVPRPDVIIVARGGGSLEDLMAFNEEVVIRAVADCRIPLISAVGHETDTTLIDFASDRRAPTPTAAAEMAVPDRAELMAALSQTAARLYQAGRARLDRSRLRLSRAEAGLPDLPSLLAGARQRLDDRGYRLDQAPMVLLRARQSQLGQLAARLPHPREAIAARRATLVLQTAHARAALNALLARRRAGFDAVAPRLPHPRAVIDGARAALGMQGQRAMAAWERQFAQYESRLMRVPDPTPRLEARLHRGRERLEGLAARLEASSYHAVLNRGFALVRGADGEPLTSAAAVAPGAALRLTFADGEVGATADGKAAPKKRGKPDEPQQGALL